MAQSASIRCPRRGCGILNLAGAVRCAVCAARLQEPSYFPQLLPTAGPAQPGSNDGARAVRAQWRCPVCTFAENSDELEACSICETKRPPKQPPTTPVRPAGSWACNQCTYLNATASSACEMCQTARENTLSVSTSLPFSPDTARIIQQANDAAAVAAAAAAADEKRASALSAEAAAGRDKEEAQGKQKEEKADSEKAKEELWSCPVCTLLNPSEGLRCAACETPRTQSCQCEAPASVLSAPSSSPSAIPSSSQVAAPAAPRAPEFNVAPAAAAPQQQQQQAVAKVVARPTVEDLEAIVNGAATGEWESSIPEDQVLIEHYREAEKQAESIRAILKEASAAAGPGKRARFIDPDFPPNASSLYGKGLPVKQQFKWERKGHKGDWCVFKDPIRPDDVQQGILGDCYFASALAVLAERPWLLQRCFITKEINPDGFYQILLCKDGKWQVITVDDFFPVKQDGSLLYSKAARNQLWVPLIEKAYAKLYGSYAAIVSGLVVDALAELTGAPCEYVRLHTTPDKEAIEPDVLWARLLSFRASGFLMGASCGGTGVSVADSKEIEAMGLQANHAYSILDIRQEGDHRLVKLRNPWGRGGWKGDWANDSPLWTPQLRKAMGMEDAKGNDGVFVMCFHDLLRYFSSVDVCKVKDGWYSLRLDCLLPPFPSSSSLANAAKARNERKGQEAAGATAAADEEKKATVPIGEEKEEEEEEEEERKALFQFTPLEMYEILSPVPTWTFITLQQPSKREERARLGDTENWTETHPDAGLLVLSCPGSPGGEIPPISSPFPLSSCGCPHDYVLAQPEAKGQEEEEVEWSLDAYSAPDTQRTVLIDCLLNPSAREQRTFLLVYSFAAAYEKEQKTPRNCTVALYSANPLLVRRGPFSTPLLSLGLQMLVASKGRPVDSFEHAVGYWFTEHRTTMYLIENRHPSLWSRVEVDASKSIATVPARSNPKTIDAVPPLHRQVVMALVAPGYDAWKVSFTVGVAWPKKRPADKNRHRPSLQNPNIFSPLPIPRSALGN